MEWISSAPFSWGAGKCLSPAHTAEGELSGKAFWERAAGNRIWQVMRKQGRKRNGFWRMACPPRRKPENDFAIV